MAGATHARHVSTRGPGVRRSTAETTETRDGWHRRHPSLLAGLVWVSVVVVANVTGKGFNDEGLEQVWQLSPFDDLQSHPLGTVWNLHVQPPLWNLVIGAVA